MVAAATGEGIGRRLPWQHESRREGLALLTAAMPDVRGADLMDLAASLPRAAERLDMRHQRVSRPPGNRSTDTDAVMAPRGRELPARLAAGGRTVVLMIDQTRATGRRQVVTVAARVGGRAPPRLGGSRRRAGRSASRSSASPGGCRRPAARGSATGADGGAASEPAPDPIRGHA